MYAKLDGSCHGGATGVRTRTRRSGHDGLRGPAGEGGSRLCNVSEVVISFHPSLGMGTRSHSLTRHKAGCVSERVGGSREGF